MTSDGKILERQRKLRNFSREALAAVLGISSDVVYRAERDDKRVARETVARIAEHLGLEFDWRVERIVPPAWAATVPPVVAMIDAVDDEEVASMVIDAVARMKVRFKPVVATIGKSSKPERKVAADLTHKGLGTRPKDVDPDKD
jgi:transcriptional regulator with XRE-family HTH domain